MLGSIHISSRYLTLEHILMTLGIYWYYKFPDGLYDYSFFKFQEGCGGHVDIAPELFAEVEVSDSDALIAELRAFVNNSNTFVFIRRAGFSVKIMVGGYMLHDYENPALWFAFIAIGGGCGLIASYRIEKKELLDPPSPLKGETYP